MAQPPLLVVGPSGSGVPPPLLTTSPSSSWKFLLRVRCFSSWGHTSVMLCCRLAELQGGRGEGINEAVCHTSVMLCCRLAELQGGRARGGGIMRCCGWEVLYWCGCPHLRPPPQQSSPPHLSSPPSPPHLGLKETLTRCLPLVASSMRCSWMMPRVVMRSLLKRASPARYLGGEKGGETQGEALLACQQ